MLRFLYCAALRAHPQHFRERFAEEMQAIFDQAESPPQQIGLLADAMLSLLRQWTLRPEFLRERATAAPDGGALLFSSLGDSKPRTVALFYGAILSALVLNGVSLTMGYAWEHPSSSTSGGRQSFHPLRGKRGPKYSGSRPPLRSRRSTPMRVECF